MMDGKARDMRTASLLRAALGAALWFGFAQQASAELVGNGDTTITDTQSGLMWLKYPLSARPLMGGASFHLSVAESGSYKAIPAPRAITQAACDLPP